MANPTSGWGFAGRVTVPFSTIDHFEREEIMRIDHSRGKKHMKRVMAGIATLCAVGLIAVPVDAGNVHLKGGKTAKPSFTDNGLSLSATGALTGLGNGDIVVNLDATADVTSTCTNPAGATQPPGQNPAPITVGGTQTIPAAEIKNGNVSFAVNTTAPDPTIAGAPDCPNPNWTEAILDLRFTSATISVEQPAGTTVFTLNCTFSPPTSDGPVPSGTVTC
jgi:hypothetical protein